MTFKHVILLLLLVGIILILNTPLKQELKVIESTSKIYFPVVSKANPCDSNKFGIAWPHGGIPDDYDRLCANWYYNTGLTNPVSMLNNNGLPMFFCDNHVDPGSGLYQDFYELAETYWLGYDGIALVLNEPDQQSQCNRTPTEAAMIFHEFEQLLPNAKLVTPNMFQLGIGDLRPFIQEYRRLYNKTPEPYRWGMHLYILKESDFGRLNEFCSVLEDEGIPCKNIWITEFGLLTCQTPTVAYNWMNRLTALIRDDPRVERAAVFTNRSYGCSYLLNSDYSFTSLGQGYIDAADPR